MEGWAAGASGGATPESWKGSPKINSTAKAVVFKSEYRILIRFGMNSPPPTFWRGARDVLAPRDPCCKVSTGVLKPCSTVADTAQTLFFQCIEGVLRKIDLGLLVGRPTASQLFPKN